MGELPKQLMGGLVYQSIINTVAMLNYWIKLFSPDVHQLQITSQTNAWKSSPKTEKRPQLDWAKTAKDWTSSLGLSLLRFQDHKKTGYGGPALSDKTGLL